MKTFAACFPILLLAACQGGVDDGAADPNESWTRTIVRSNGPGQPPTVTEETIHTSGVQLDSLDSGCSTADARLWSGNNFTGSEICFSGMDDIDLSQYYMVHCTSLRFCTFWPWSNAVRSFKTGDYFGLLYKPNGTFTPDCGTYLDPHQQIAAPDTCMPQATRFDNGIDPTKYF